LLYAEQNKYTEAITLLETAITKSAANPRIYYNLGLLYQMTGQNEKCEAALEKGLKSDLCNFDLLYALYSFQRKLNNRTKASLYIERLKICFPNEKQVRDMYNDFSTNR
jgi:tetratricopeptide (TPR) repeat protein